ncbi:MAG: hypothetical protein AAF702_51550 [Chloroflexota bacterium]
MMIIFRSIGRIGHRSVSCISEWLSPTPTECLFPEAGLNGG